MLRVIKTVLAIELIWLLAGCTERSLEVRKDEGFLIVSPDWQNMTVPSSTAYHFYTETGLNTPYAYSEVAGDTFSCALPTGTYRMLAYNTGVSGVEFVSQENITQTTARLISDVQPGSLYVWSVDQVDVHYRDTLCLMPVPHLLVRTLWLKFYLKGIYGIKSIEGSLYGVYPSVSLLTGMPSDESLAAAPATSVLFTVEIDGADGSTKSKNTRNESSVSSGVGSSSVHLFGLLNPEDGKCYDNRLHLRLCTASGDDCSTEVDMNDVLSSMFKENVDDLPPEVPVEIEIEIKWINSSLAASVRQWSIGKGEGSI